MTVSSMLEYLNKVKMAVAGALVAGGIMVSAVGVLKVPAQQASIAAALTAHNALVLTTGEATNKKLDVLICLQAKLDTPIKCVSKGN